jgi:hypothetical protein
LYLFPFLLENCLSICFVVYFFPCIFSPIMFRLLFQHSIFLFLLYLVLPDFLRPLCPAVCSCHLSLQGRLTPYFCPYKSAHCWCHMSRTLRPYGTLPRIKTVDLVTTWMRCLQSFMFTATEGTVLLTQ